MTGRELLVALAMNEHIDLDWEVLMVDPSSTWRAITLDQDSEHILLREPADG